MQKLRELAENDFLLIEEDTTIQEGVSKLLKNDKNVLIYKQMGQFYYVDRGSFLLSIQKGMDIRLGKIKSLGKKAVTFNADTPLFKVVERMEDKAEFEEMLHTLDVPASAIRNPTCVGRLERLEPLACNEVSFVREITDVPVKVTLPGPYLLTRSMWIGDISKGDAYQDKTEMASDVVRILRDELVELRDAGVAFVQFDEPVLTEVVFSEECNRRTFM